MLPRASFGSALALAALFLPTSPAMAGPFTDDLAFLEKHTDSFTLGTADGRIIVTPEYQGRVMTSTVGGDQDPSFGWLNYELIKQGVLPPDQRAGRIEEHIHVFGGEERFWMGPEGGQFAIFFKPGTSFTLDHWHTPAPIDSEPFHLAERSESRAVFTRRFSLLNHSGTRFEVGVRRTVRVLPRQEIEKLLEVRLPDALRLVGYETDNQLTNRGDHPWTTKGGLLSVWILGMYKPGDAITTVIPVRPGDLGPLVNASYFGKVPAEKLVVRDNHIFFSGDGTHRSKIGVSPRRSLGIAGSYDAQARVLNIVACNQPGPDQPYVNSMWELQDDPFGGDVINSYNDGPPSPGAKPLGPFYELETSSPGAQLAPGQSIRHVQRTYHFQGPEPDLDPLARTLLGVSLADISTALP